MTVVGEVSLGVVPLAGTFTADLTKIANEGAAVAARESAKTFGLEFSKALRTSIGGTAAMFTGVDVEAAKAGIASGKSYASGFTEAVRVNGMSATILGTDTKGIASAQAAGAASGRAYSRGMAAGSAEGNFASGLSQSLRGAEAAAVGSGDRAGRLWISGLASGLGKAGQLTALALAAVGFESIKMATEFDKQMELLHTQAGASQAEVDSLKNSVLNLAGVVGQGPNKLAEALFHIESDGYRGAEALDILKLAAEGAATGNAKLDDTTYALVSTMKALGDQGLAGATKDMATLNAIVGAGDIRMQQLNGALSTGILGTMKTFGVSLESTGAALDYLTQRGEPAQQSATRLAMGMVLLAAPTKQAAKYLTDVGLASQVTADQQSAVQQALEKSGLTTTRLAADMRKPDGIAVAIQDLNTHLHASGITADESSALIARSFGGGRTGKAIMQMAVDVGGISDAFKMVTTQESKFSQDVAATQQTLAFKWHSFVADLQVDLVKFGHFLEPIASGAITLFEGIGTAIAGTFHFLKDHEQAVLAVVAAYALLKWETIAANIQGFAAVAVGALRGVALSGMSLVSSLVALGPYAALAAVTIGLLAAGYGNLEIHAKEALPAVSSLTDELRRQDTTGQINSFIDALQNSPTKDNRGESALQYLERYKVNLQGLFDVVSSGDKTKSLAFLTQALQGAKADGASGQTLVNLAYLISNLTGRYGDAKTALDALNHAQVSAIPPSHQLTAAQMALKTAQEQLGVAQKDGTPVVLGLAQQHVALAKAALDANQKIDNLDAAVRISATDSVSFIDAIEGWNDKAAQSQQQLASAQSGLTSAQQGLTDKQTAYNTALGKFGAGSAQAKSAYADLQNAVHGVTTAQDALNKAQPPSVQSILQKLGLDDASLRGLTGATNKLIGEGISGDALTRLIGLNDPRAITAFSQGGAGVVQQLNAAVAKFVSDTNAPGSFAQLSTGAKKGGADFVNSFITNVRSRAHDVQVADDATFRLAAHNTMSGIILLARTAGQNMPIQAAAGIKEKTLAYIAQLASTFTGPQQVAVTALEKLALTGGARMSQNLANAIETGKPLVINQQTAVKDGLNTETRKILDKWGIHIFVDDKATIPIRNIAKELGALAPLAATAGVVPTYKPSPVKSTLDQLLLPGAAKGRMIEGPGTTTSDSILGVDALSGLPTAWVSRDEMVVNAKSTAKHRGLLDAINADGLADGGVAGLTGASSVMFNADSMLARMQTLLDTITTAANPQAGPGQSFPLIIEYMKRSGIGFTMADPGLGRGGHSYHEAGQAVDFSGGDLTAMANYWMKVHNTLLEEIHSPSWYVKNGQVVGPDFYGANIDAQHYNHVHIAASLAAMSNLLGVSGGFGGTVPNGPVQAMAKALLAQRGWSDQWDAFNSLEMREAGWNVHATNPSSGAYGIPQSLPADKMAAAGADWRDNPQTQLRWMMQYIAETYGDPAGAWAHEVSHSWYDNGGLLPPGMNLTMNGTGQPEAILTGSQWDSLATLANGGIAGGLSAFASGGVVTGTALSDLHKAAAEANREVAAYLRSLAEAAKKQQTAQQHLISAYLRSLAAAQKQIDKFGVHLGERQVTSTISTGQKQIAAAVKEGNGPLQKALEAHLRTAEGRLYGVGLNAVRGGRLSPTGLFQITAAAKTVTDLTAQLTKLNTVNVSLLDSLKTFASTQQQYRDSLNTSVSAGAGFTDLLKLSGSPADLKTAEKTQLASLTSFLAKIRLLKARGYSDVIVRDVAQDGILNGTLYADMLLTASKADVKAITGGFGALSTGQLGAANTITSLTEGRIPGITQTTAANYINTAIFTTTGGNVDLLLAKAEFAQRTGQGKKFDGGGYLYPGRTVADNTSGGREKVLDRTQTAAWESGQSGGGMRPVTQTNHYHGVDLATAQAQSARELSLALAGARVDG